MRYPSDRERIYQTLFDLYQQFLGLSGCNWNVEIIFDDFGEPEFYNSDIPTVIFQEHNNTRVRTDLLYYFLVSVVESYYDLGMPEDQILNLLNPFNNIPKKFIFKKYNPRRIK